MQTTSLANKPFPTILFVCMGGIGDVILSLPTVTSIQQAFPDSTFVFLTSEQASFKFLRSTGISDHVEWTGPNPKNPLRLASFLFRMRRKYSFDLGISSAYSNQYNNSLLLKLLGAPIRIGDSSGTDKHYFTHVHELDRSLHEVHANLELLRHLHIQPPSEPKIEFPMSDSMQAYAHSFLQTRNLETAVRIGVHIGPQDPDKWFRYWPTEKFCELIQRLSHRLSATIILTGGKGEWEAANQIEREAGAAVINMVNQTSMEELIGLLSTLHLYCGNDSGPLHLASAFDFPIVGLFGPTHYNRMGPFSRQLTIIRKDLECSPCYSPITRTVGCPELHCWQGITVDEVEESIASLLPAHLERLQKGNSV